MTGKKLITYGIGRKARKDEVRAAAEPPETVPRCVPRNRFLLQLVLNSNANSFAATSCSCVQLRCVK